MMDRSKQVDGWDGSANPAHCTRDEVRQAFAGFGIDVDPDIASQLCVYLELLLRWNDKVALTSITDPQEILERHFAESIFGAKQAGIRDGRLLDIGSGAGFPGVPISLFVHGLRVVLLEPNLKKSVFLAEACRRLGLEDRVGVERARLEDYRGGGTQFDFMTTRAVRLSARRLRQCAELLQPEGKIVLWLGSREINAVVQLGDWRWSEPVRTPGSKQRYVMWGSPW